MNRFKKNEEDIKVICPPVLGWLEKKLNQQEIDYLWKCIQNKKESYKKNLAGNIHESNILIDKSDWFFINTLSPLCTKYTEKFKNIGDDTPINQKHPYYLSSFWVNYQKENEFNPVHRHKVCVYSFVVWMKIPTNHLVQNRNPIASFSNHPSISSFEFQYVNILGEINSYRYKMNPSVEGTLLFFPSSLNHCVYPFYNCKEDRISISGNIAINTAKAL